MCFPYQFLFLRLDAQGGIAGSYGVSILFCFVLKFLNSLSPVILSVQAMDKFIHYLFGPIWVLENMNRNLILGSHKQPMNSKGDR